MNQGVMMFKRSVWYIIGLNCIALSVVLNIRFDLGVAAFSSVMYAISEIYHISLGMASIICYLIFVVLQCLMSKKVTPVSYTHLLVPFSHAWYQHTNHPGKTGMADMRTKALPLGASFPYSKQRRTRL